MSLKKKLSLLSLLFILVLGSSMTAFAGEDKEYPDIPSDVTFTEDELIMAIPAFYTDAETNGDRVTYVYIYYRDGFCYQCVEYNLAEDLESTTYASRSWSDSGTLSTILEALRSKGKTDHVYEAGKQTIEFESYEKINVTLTLAEDKSGNKTTGDFYFSTGWSSKTKKADNWEYDYVESVKMQLESLINQCYLILSSAPATTETKYFTNLAKVEVLLQLEYTGFTCTYGGTTSGGAGDLASGYNDIYVVHYKNKEKDKREYINLNDNVYMAWIVDGDSTAFQVYKKIESDTEVKGPGEMNTFLDALTKDLSVISDFSYVTSLVTTYADFMDTMDKTVDASSAGTNAINIGSYKTSGTDLSTAPDLSEYIDIGSFYLLSNTYEGSRQSLRKGTANTENMVFELVVYVYAGTDAEHTPAGYFELIWYDYAEKGEDEPYKYQFYEVSTDQIIDLFSCAVNPKISILMADTKKYEVISSVDKIDSEYTQRATYLFTYTTYSVSSNVKDVNLVDNYLICDDVAFIIGSYYASKQRNWIRHGTEGEESNQASLEDGMESILANLTDAENTSPILWEVYLGVVNSTDEMSSTTVDDLFDSTVGKSSDNCTVRDGDGITIVDSSESQSVLWNHSIEAYYALAGFDENNSEPYKFEIITDDGTAYLIDSALQTFINNSGESPDEWSNTVDEAKYPNLYNLVEDYIYFAQKAVEFVGDTNQQSAASSLINSTATGSDYYMWARSIGYYITSEGIQTEKDGYDLTKFSQGSLTDEELLSLQAWYTLLTGSYGCVDCSNGALIFPDSGGTVSFNRSAAMSLDAVQSYLSSLESVSALTTGVYDDDARIRDLYQIVQYCVGLVYDDDMTQYNTMGSLDNYLVKVGDYKDALAYEGVFAYAYDSSGDTSLYEMKEMSNVGYVSGSDTAYMGLYNIYYNLTFAQSWVDSNWTTINNILEPLRHYTGVSDDSVSSYAQYIKGMRAICETLEFLGMEPFTEHLAEIWSYRNTIDDLYDRLIALGIEDTYEEEDELLGDFFSKSQTQFSTDYKEGVALSATYIPFETNLYETASVTYVSDTEWVSRFHYPYGFYRKVLYIDTDTNAAVNRYVTGTTSSGKEIATLRDLMETEKDIVLYLDTNFYNADEIADYMNKVWNKTTNSADADNDGSAGIFASITHTIKDQMNVSMEAILKTAGYTTYSSNIESKVKKDDTDSATDYIFSEEDIKALLTVYSEDGSDEVYNDYTVLQSFAVVSAIYRDKALYNNLSSVVKANDPVFVSSPNLAGTEGIGQEEFNSIYNYAMLKNLEAALPLDADVTLDLDAPLFMDIYGNIITEDGYVVIPAASNATLCGDDAYDPHTAGFIYYYNQGAYAIPEDYNNADDFITGYFSADGTTDTYKLSWGQFTESGTTLRYDFSNFPLSNESAMQFLKSLAWTNFGEYSVYGNNFYKRVYLITEVLRGAPLEYIDYEFEGITSYTDVSKIGVYFADKLDWLADALLSKTNGNSLIELPNLAFMEGVEYVILFLFKIIFAACLALLFYRMYIDAVQGCLGIKTMTSFVISMVMFLVVSFAIPEALDISYYQVNKRLLQSETEYIAMLNLEKSSEGREIGVTSVSAPETETELYLKVDDLSIPWYSILDDVLFKSTFSTVSEIYDEALEDSALANLPGFVKKGDGLYISVDYLFDTSVIEYESGSENLISIVTETPYASYVTPYYAILDLLVARVNYYNSENSYETYTTTVQSGGRVRTKGAITAYFLSEDFLENSSDVLGLRAMYGMDVLWAYDVDPFDDEDLEKMSYSYWYRDNYDEDELEEIFQKLDTKARKFVADNRSLLGKISDETFLKVMALSMAVEYNKAMKISSANAIEIYDIDTRDLLRLSVADKSTVMSQCSKSFARFIFDEAGSLGTVVVAFLLVIYFLASWGKAIMIFIILGSMIAAAVFRRTIKRDERGSIEGVIVTLAILCGTNVLYALLLKCTMLIPQLGVTTVVACFIQVILQIVYLVIMAALTWVVLSDWKNVGFSTYTMFAHKAYYRIRDGRSDSHRTILRSRNTVVEKEGKRQSRKGNSANTGEMTANDMLRRMIDEDYERKEYKRK